MPEKDGWFAAAGLLGFKTLGFFFNIVRALQVAEVIALAWTRHWWRCKV